MPLPTNRPGEPDPQQPGQQMPGYPQQPPAHQPPAHQPQVPPQAPVQPQAPGYPPQPPVQPAAAPQQPYQQPHDTQVEAPYAQVPQHAPEQPYDYAEPQATHDDQGGSFLDSLGLAPHIKHSAQLLLDILADDECSEVLMNGPNEIHRKVRGQRFHVPEIAFGDAETYHHVLNEVVLPFVDTRHRIDGSGILIEGQMEISTEDPTVPPMLARVHMLAPPLVTFAKVTVAKKSRYDLDLDTIASTGAMSIQMCEFLKSVAYGRLTFVVAGPTGAGKTTLLQAMTRHFDQNDRVVVIEDTPELRLPLGDVVSLVSTNARPGMRAEDIVTTEWLVRGSQRMRMDRVIVGECRGAEMAEWLIAANSGADGSATTVHADNPRRALDKILALATKSPTSGSEETLRREIAATIDIVIQARLIDGQNVITHIEEIVNTVGNNGVITSTTLFEYNPATRTHEVKALPSEAIQATLRSRGVPINVADFRTI